MGKIFDDFCDRAMRAVRAAECVIDVNRSEFGKVFRKRGIKRGFFFSGIKAEIF